MMTLMEAYELACREVEAHAPVSQATAGTFVDEWNQVRRIPKSTPFEHMRPDQRPDTEKVTASPGLGGQPCLAHREKVFTFTDGSVMKSCAHTFCEWGRSTKKHSDGIVSGTLYSPDIEVDDDTPSPDEPQELGMPVVDDAVEGCIDEVERVERAADEAATEGDEDDDDITDEE
jgi:hypothetical protein